MAQGRIDAPRLLAKPAFEIIRSLALLDAEGPVPIRCLVAAFNVQDGVLKPQTLLISTPDTRVAGQGSIALGREEFDITLVALAKDFTLLAGQAPIHIRGSFSEPEIEVSTVRIALSLLTPFELGTSGEVACQRLIRQVRRP